MDLVAEMEKEGKENKEKALETSVNEELFDSVLAYPDFMDMLPLLQSLKHSPDDLLPNPFLAPLTPPPNAGA